MDPYRVLGLPSTASIEQAEAAFRRLLKEVHPDRQVGADEPTLAAAAERTRQVTAAIALIRAGWRAVPRDPRPPTTPPPPPGSPPPEGRTRDWFGNPLDPEERHDGVACPFCGERFWRVDVFELHLGSRHPTADPRGAKHDPIGAVVRRLRFLPAPSFTLAVLLGLWWALVVWATPPPVERVGIWIGVIGFLVLRGLAERARRRRL